MQVGDAGVADAAHAAETLQQLRAFLRADAGDVLEAAAAGAHAGAAGPHAGDREAVRLVADLGDEHQRCRIAAQRDLRTAVGEHQFLQPDLAAFALLDADDPREVDAEFGEHLARHADLPASAVDQHQVRQARLAAARRLDQLRVAPHQHLAHRRVVVAGGDAVDVVAPVLRALHLVGLEDDARGLGRFAARCG